mmetsp:Transcript_12535/g.39231  ORF Transcript_12535/g.39231 Transcript_12535/m.39231 type:complete len:213 (+) Transcript_12535:1182-1820(+)
MAPVTRRVAFRCLSARFWLRAIAWPNLAMASSMLPATAWVKANARNANVSLWSPPKVSIRDNAAFAASNASLVLDIGMVAAQIMSQASASRCCADGFVTFLQSATASFANFAAWSHLPAPQKRCMMDLVMSAAACPLRSSASANRRSALSACSTASSKLPFAKRTLAKVLVTEASPLVLDTDLNASSASVATFSACSILSVRSSSVDFFTSK